MPLLKRTMTTVSKEINSKPLGIALNVAEVAVVGGIGYFLSRNDTSGCGHLPSVLKIFQGCYAWDLCSTVFVWGCGYKFGIQYVSMGVGLGMLSAWIGGSISALSWWMHGGCKPNVLWAAFGVLGYYTVSDLYLKASMISEDDQKLMMEKLGIPA